MSAPTPDPFFGAVLRETGLGGHRDPVDPRLVLRVLGDSYGLYGTLAPIATEKDDTYRLDSPAGQFLVKVSPPDEDPGLVDLQTAAMTFLARTAPELPAQRVVPNGHGGSQVPLPAGGRFPRVLRVLGFIPGLLLEQAEPTQRELAAVGDMLARVSQALRPFRHERDRRLLLWDLANFARLGGVLVDTVPDPYRPLARRIVDDFVTVVEPVAAELEQQVVHGDFSPFNLVVRPGSGQFVTGIIDFGDVVRTAVIFDVAVPMANLIGADGNAPWAAAVTLLGGYRRRRPLPEAHAALLREAALARLLLRAMVTGWHAEQSPDRHQYLLSHGGRDWTRLATAAAVPAPDVRALIAATSAQAPSSATATATETTR